MRRMIGGLREKVRKLRDLPRDLFASIYQLRDAVEQQNHAIDDDVRALNQQLPEVADSLLKILLQMRAWGLPDDGSSSALSANTGTLQARPAGSSDGMALEPSSVGRLPPWRQHDLVMLREAVRSGLVQAMDKRDEAISGQIQEIVQLQRDNSWLLPSHLWMPEVGERVLRVLSVLRPFRIGNAVKTRLGRANDGGYVIVDDFVNIDSALSLGIDGDVSWDLAVAARGIKVLQYDHTVAGPPDSHPLFDFHKTRIAAEDADGSVSIQTLLRDRKAAGDRRVILKVDIEGDEWQCLADVDTTDLQVCSQIVCEFHNLHRLAEAEFAELAHRCFTRLCTGFFVCHVHANNCGNVYNIGNVLVADTLEITFANRTHYQPVDSLEIFPTPIDMPNQPGRADIFLGAFRYSA
jgi:hypothetical protein